MKSRVRGMVGGGARQARMANESLDEENDGRLKMSRRELRKRVEKIRSREARAMVAETRVGRGREDVCRSWRLISVGACEKMA